MSHQRLIILEGPDASGKSTLASALSKHYDMEQKHFTYYKNENEMINQFLDGIDIITRCELNNKQNVIFDRFIVSNLVYGMVFHDCDFVKCWKLCLETLMNSMSCADKITLIYCLPEFDIWLKNYKEMCNFRDEMYIDEEKMSKVYNLFLMFGISMSGNENIQVLIVDPFKTSVSEIIEMIG